MKRFKLRKVLILTTYIVIFIVSLFVFNAAIIGSFYKGKDFTFAQLIEYIDLSPLTFYHLASYQAKPKSEERASNVVARMLEYKRVTPAHEERFHAFVYDRYFKDLLADHGKRYEDYIGVTLPSSRSHMRGEEGGKYGEFDTSRSICTAVFDRIQKDLDYVGVPVAHANRLDCRVRPRTKEYFAEIVLSGINKSFDSFYTSVRSVLLNNRSENSTRKRSHYSTQISLTNIDLSYVQKWCQLGVTFMCVWSDEPQYLIIFESGFRHDAVLRVDNTEVVAPTNGPLAGFLTKHHSVLMEVSPRVVQLDYSMHYNRDVFYHDDYFDHIANTSIRVVPLLQKFESLMGYGRSIDQISVDISLTTSERVRYLFSRVLSSVPATTTVVLSVINMLLMLSLLLRGNFQTLKQVIKKQAKHDL